MRSKYGYPQGIALCPVAVRQRDAIVHQCILTGPEAVCVLGLAGMARPANGGAQSLVLKRETRGLPGPIDRCGVPVGNRRIGIAELERYQEQTRRDLATTRVQRAPRCPEIRNIGWPSIQYDIGNLLTPDDRAQDEQRQQRRGSSSHPSHRFSMGNPVLRVQTLLDTAGEPSFPGYLSVPDNATLPAPIKRDKLDRRSGFRPRPYHQQGRFTTTRRPSTVRALPHSSNRS